MIAIAPAGAIWAAVYLVFGWPGVFVVLVVSVAGELVIFGSAELAERRDRAIAEGRWRVWHVYDWMLRWRSRHG